MLVEPGETEETGKSFIQIILGLLGLVLLWLFAYALVTTSYKDWREWNQLNSSGITTQAVIITIDQRGKGGRGVLYEYQAFDSDGNPSTIQVWGRVNEEMLSGLSEGESVTIVYDPSNPSTSRIEGNDQYSTLLILGLLLTCVNVVVTIIFIMGGFVLVIRKFKSLLSATNLQKQ